MIASNSATVAGPTLAASRIILGRRPFRVAAMRARHVLGDRGVPVANGGDAWLATRWPLWKTSTVALVMRASTISRISLDGTE